MRKFICFLFTVFLLFSTSACAKPKCKHAYQNYVVKSPTCTEKGLLEKLCDICGEKSYEDLAATGHSFINGECTICNQKGSSGTDILPEPMPENANNSAMWSLQKIYETAKTFSFNGTYEDFLNSLSVGCMQDVYVDILGFFHLTSIKPKDGVSYEYPLFFPVGKVSPVNTKESKLANVYRLEMNGENLLITYSDGLQVSAGKISKTASIYVTGFGLNVKNELVIYYSNNTIAFAGTVAEGNPPENQAKFVYQETIGGYNVHYVYTDEEVIRIPISHRGKPILKITNNAFYNVTATVKSIIIPESVNFDAYAFGDLTSSTNLYFEKELLNPLLILTSANVYGKNQWRYVNGIPTPNPNL